MGRLGLQLSSDQWIRVTAWLCVGVGFAMYTHAPVCMCEREFTVLWLSGVPARCGGSAARYNTCMSSQTTAEHSM